MIKGTFIKPISTTTVTSGDTYKVKLDENDSPDYLGNKLNQDNLYVTPDYKLSVNIQDDIISETTLWSSEKTKKYTMFMSIIFG